MGPAVAAVLVAFSLPIIGFTAWTLLKSSRAPRPEPVLAHPEPPAVEPPVVEPDPPAEPPKAEPQRPTESAPAAPKAPPKPKPEETPVRVEPTRLPVEPERTPDTPASVAPAEEAAPKGDGMLTVSSIPRAQVMIDGQYVRFTPLYQHSVSAGSHTILLVAEDGRRKTFRVDVVPGAEIRRIWLFEEGKWSE